MPQGVAVRVRARACWNSQVQVLVQVLVRGLHHRHSSSVVEHPIRNRAVIGSIPICGSSQFQGRSKPTATDTFTVSVAFCFHDVGDQSRRLERVVGCLVPLSERFHRLGQLIEVLDHK